MSTCVQTANATASRDPTNTIAIRRAFLQEIRRRFRRVRGLVRTTVGYENDALELTQEANAEPRDSFVFESDTGRVGQFYRWLLQALQDEVLEPLPRSKRERGEHWTAEYLRRAYLQGWNQGTGLLFQRGASVRNYDDEDILNRPIPLSQLRRLFTVTYDDLEEMVTDVADDVREELASGLAKGENPRKIARRLTKTIRKLQHTRAETLARTMIIDSHSTATLDRYDDAGVDVVSHGEWATAGDDRVCPICQAMEGREFTTQEMRDTTFEMEGIGFEVRLRPPAHPNGRCAIYPVIGVDPPTEPLEARLPDEPVDTES